MTDNAIKDPYRVKHGDTLHAIAKASGTSISEITRLNRIANPNRLEIGQTLYLSRESAFGVTVLFLDMLRHPIDNLHYKIHYDGQTTAGKTQADGKAPRITTKHARSRVEVTVKDLRGQWVDVCNVASDHGHKLLTLVSGMLVFNGATEEHPEQAPEKPTQIRSAANLHHATQPALPKPANGVPIKNNPHARTRKTKGTHGQSIIEVGVDIPAGLLGYFDKYRGGDITDQHWREAADFLDCDPAVLKALAKLESGENSSFWRLNSKDGAFVPAILFERHFFSRATKGQYDAAHPDISWPSPYRKKNVLGHADKKMRSGKVELTDIYGSFSSSYLRLINAYRFDPEAALASCSWGKFQIMGANRVLCGEPNLKKFVEQMCTSEAAQLNLAVAHIKKKPRPWKDVHRKELGKEISLWDAVKTKNWAAIAFNFNGKDYKTFHYDSLLKAAYEEYRTTKI